MNLKTGYFSSLLILALAGSGTAYANPNGAQVIKGKVHIAHPDPNTLNITNSPGAIVNWQQFSIQTNQVTRFIQQNAASAILNRVVGQNPSALLGQLLSNGRIFLINPNGIVFGPNSVIDTAGLIASTLDMTDEDFINQNLKFQGSNAADIQNQGYIKAGKNGDIFLIAPNIENSGIIETDGGQIILAAGESITIASLDSDHIVFDVQAPEHEVVNLGEMITNGGAASMFAGTIKHSGSINANSLSFDEQGNVQLFAKADIKIDSTATITANGSTGGEIKIESDGGTVWNSGTIEAKGEDGNGGLVEVLGERVALLDEASIDVSGETGGGEVLVGGDYQGKNEDVKNAKQSYIGKNTSIKADAVTNGDGGKVIVWADETTQFYGDISAKGGADTGDGGFVETSGKDYLEALGKVDASAANGEGGEWLLDPNDIDLQSVGANAPTDDSTNGTWNFVSPATGPPDPNVFSGGAGAGIADIDTIIYALELGTGVTITTSTGSGGTGNITVTDAIGVTLNNGNVLFTLDADNNIIINNSITATGANTLTLGLDAPGTITVNGDIDTNGGLIDAQSMGAGNVTFSGTRIIDSDLNATTLTINSTDNISLNGTSTTNTFTHSSGILAGSGSLTVNTTWTPTSGVFVNGNLILGSGINKFLPSVPAFVLNGTGTLTNQGILTLLNSTINTDFDNQGTLRVANNWSSFINGAVVGNSGTIDFLGTGNPTNLTIANGFSSDGTIQLTRGTLTISAGTLINNGTIQSDGAAGSVLTGRVTNLGTIDVDAALTLNNSGFFRSDAGTIDVATGQTFTVNGGTTQLGNGTGFLGTGTMNMIGTPTIDLLSDLTWPASSVVLTLGLGSVTTIQSLAGATFINQGVLNLTNDIINANIDNQGTLQAANNWSSFINGTVVGNSGTIDFLGTGNPTNLTIANGFSSDGTIQLTRGTLTISAGTLINNGTIQSDGAAGSTLTGQVTNLGTIDVDANLTLNNSGFFRSDAGTIDVATGQTFTVNGGTTQLGNGTGFLGTGTMNMIGTPTIDLLSDLTWPASSVVLTLGLGSVTTIQSLAGATFINQGGTEPDQ